MSVQMYAYLLPLSVIILGILFFICVTNAIYAKIDAKNPSTWVKQSVFKTSKAWLIYACCIALTIGFICLVALSNVLNGFASYDSVKKQQQQQQSQSTSTDADTDEAQTQVQK